MGVVVIEIVSVVWVCRHCGDPHGVVAGLERKDVVHELEVVVVPEADRGADGSVVSYEGVVMNRAPRVGGHERSAVGARGVVGEL